MTDFLYHATGACGEWHLNLWHVLLLSACVYAAYKKKLRKT